MVWVNSWRLQQTIHHAKPEDRLFDHGAGQEYVARAGRLHTLSEDGKDYDFYNNTPSSAITRISGAYGALYGTWSLTMANIPADEAGYPGSNQDNDRKIFLGKTGKNSSAHTWSTAFYDKIDNLKFLGYVDADAIGDHPVDPAQSLDREYMIFSFGAYGESWLKSRIHSGGNLRHVAFDGRCARTRHISGRKARGRIKSGMVQLDFVYNPMPPVPAQIYPDVPVQPVVEF